MKEGQEYNINGESYLVLSKYNVNDKKYVLFSIGENKLDYKFYEYTLGDNDNYEFSMVTDPVLESYLFEEFYKKEGKNNG